MTKRLAAGCGIENHTCLDLPLVQKKVFKVKFDTLFTKSSAKVRSTQKRALFLEAYDFCVFLVSTCLMLFWKIMDDLISVGRDVEGSHAFMHDVFVHSSHFVC